jgi:hypothetical protein
VDTKPTDGSVVAGEEGARRMQSYKIVRMQIAGRCTVHERMQVVTTQLNAWPIRTETITRRNTVFPVAQLYSSCSGCEPWLKVPERPMAQPNWPLPNTVPRGCHEIVEKAAGEVMAHLPPPMKSVPH